MLSHGGDSGLCRLWVGAAVKVWPRDFQHDETCCVLRFQEEIGGKSRLIPVRQDLERAVRACLEATGIKAENNDRSLLRPTTRRMKHPASNTVSSESICGLVKRRVKDAGLPKRMSSPSFLSTEIADLLGQGMQLEDVQYLEAITATGRTTVFQRQRKRKKRTGPD